jgi:hypothetical protein
MLVSTDFASENDLLDRIMDRGIVVEVWDRLQLGGIDMTGMHISVAELHLFGKEKTQPFRTGYLSKAEGS